MGRILDEIEIPLPANISNGSHVAGIASIVDDHHGL